jgi:hypothetical protein
MKPRIIKFSASGVWAVELDDGLFPFPSWRIAVEALGLFDGYTEHYYLVKFPKVIG